MVVIVDTREQKPYQFERFFRAALCVGDYTTVSLFNKVHVERKSPEDWYGTITLGHSRFRREILRAKERCIKLVIVIESTRKNFIAKNFPRGDQRKISSTTLDRICATIERRYCLEIHWCKDRSAASKKVYKLLNQKL